MNDGISLKTRCVARIKPKASWNFTQCGKSASFKHEGLMYCKLHHPPNVEAKRKERARAYSAKVAEQLAVRKQHVEEAAEQARRAALYPELLEALKDSVRSQPADSPIRWVIWAREAIAKATGEQT